MELKPGVLIAERYRVERVLLADEGGTLLATRASDGSVVAVKVLPSSASSPQLITRFARAKDIRSPHVPKLLELGGLDDGRTFIAMEHLEGTSLKARLARGPLSLSDAVDATLQACRAVAAAHHAGAIHRRLKTSRLFETRAATGALEIKVLGFVAGSLSGDVKSGDVPDDVDYLAPEQLTGIKNGERGADIWALGVIFYELLTGRLPFTAITRKAVAKRVLGEEPKRPRSICSELPWQLEQVLLRCLEKAPASRIDAGALVTALEPFATPSVRAGAERTLAFMSHTAVMVAPPPPSGLPIVSHTAVMVAPGAPPELPNVTKLHHLHGGAAGSPAERSSAFHRLRSDGQIEGLKVDEVADLARARRVEEEAGRLKHDARRQGGGSSAPPARSIAPPARSVASPARSIAPPARSSMTPAPRDARSRAPADPTRRIVFVLIVAAVFLGLGTGLLVRLLGP